MLRSRVFWSSWTARSLASHAFSGFPWLALDSQKCSKTPRSRVFLRSLPCLGYPEVSQNTTPRVFGFPWIAKDSPRCSKTSHSQVFWLLFGFVSRFILVGLRLQLSRYYGGSYYLLSPSAVVLDPAGLPAAPWARSLARVLQEASAVFRLRHPCERFSLSC